MDPKTLPTLNPQLKEAYERVMGTSVTPAAPPVPVSMPTTTTPPSPAPQPVAAPPSPVPPLTPTHHASTTFVAGNATQNKTKNSPVIFIFAGIVFFVVYVLFWMKFFNFKLPF